MNELEKTIQNAQKDFEKFRDREDWSSANQKLGFLNGVKEYAERHHNKRGVEYWRGLFISKLESAIEDQEYGEAAYWRAFLNGMDTAETSHRLDVLRAKEAQPPATA